MRPTGNKLFYIFKKRNTLTEQLSVKFRLFEINLPIGIIPSGILAFVGVKPGFCLISRSF